MNWGRRKKLSSPYSSSIITRVFPVSWFSSKLKQKAENSEAKNKHKNEVNFFPTPNSKVRFYSMDEDDHFSRLCFGEERIIPSRRSTGGMINPVWYDFDHEFRFPVSTREEEEEEEECRNFNSGERDIFPVDLEYMVQMKEESSKLTSLSENMKIIKEIKVKTKHKSKVKAYSPRTECKIRALEEMKKARMKMKKEKTVFNNFAVVKNSFDPQRDFRDSMVEMIREKGIIRRYKDVEELLACYLALNSNEYHDIIINVFRNVWFELKGVKCFDD